MTIPKEQKRDRSINEQLWIVNWIRCKHLNVLKLKLWTYIIGNDEQLFRYMQRYNWNSFVVKLMILFFNELFLMMYPFRWIHIVGFNKGLELEIRDPINNKTFPLKENTFYRMKLNKMMLNDWHIHISEGTKREIKCSI